MQNNSAPSNTSVICYLELQLLAMFVKLPIIDFCQFEWLTKKMLCMQNKLLPSPTLCQTQFQPFGVSRQREKGTERERLQKVWSLLLRGGGSMPR